MKDVETKVIVILLIAVVCIFALLWLIYDNLDRSIQYQKSTGALTLDKLVDYQKQINQLSNEISGVQIDTEDVKAHMKLINEILHNETSMNLTKEKEWNVVKASYQCAGSNFKNLTRIGVYGMSMRPYLFDGDEALYVEYQPHLKLVEGDVVLVNNTEGIVVHRVVGIYPDYFVMQGDNNPYPDNAMYSYTEIYGIVCATRRGVQ